ncbi:LON peptidase substrate-binding domain-containing protein [Amycolatopsis cynarae]|uniref:LON peptidase substrate-binding domain-containing protein n=1 Tax=Amycolatopsis cynarae TaxID=2995223 RepID=A0ABY7B7W9_9PSEU|nr:LON peptidase substrate-binding domain-containing protein [Amycolatopsis sp. HUAS 11-8]WAL67288.1 LON peptidase substrate-binding domain-containing protein [Amycolatopsis sp. HUAS 11-8]
MKDAEPQDGEKTTLPLFPLQTVLLPGAVLPLHLFEPRYRQLALDLLSGTVPDRRFGIVAIRTAMVREVESVEHVHAIGCAAVLRDSERLPDGRFDILTHGERRFRLLDIDQTQAPYLMATVEWVPDERLPAAAADATSRLAGAARSAYRRYCESAWERAAWTPPPPDTSPAALAYLLAADCLLPLPDRQRLLEETHPLRRLRLTRRLLTREAGFLSALNAVPAPPPELPYLDSRACLN